MNLKDYIKDVPNYPKEGILFKDITPLLLDKDAFNYAIDEISAFANSVDANVVLGPESRGFIFGCPVAYKNKIGFVPVRKPGKLPRKTIEESYDLEYGSNTLCIHEDAIKEGDKVRVKKGAKSYDGVALASFVYENVYDVIDLNGSRAVIGKGGAVTAAIHIDNLYK